MRSLSLLLAVFVVSIAATAAAAPVQSGAVSASSPTFKWQGGPLSGGNMVGEPCGTSHQCEDILLTVGDKGDLEIAWKASSPSDQAALNFELYKSDAEGNAEGAAVASGGAFGSEGAIKAKVEPRHYIVRVGALLATAATYEAEATLVVGSEETAEYGDKPEDASAPDWYKKAGAEWFQAYFDEADGTRLHADVLRPAGVPIDQRTPVILSIGPYFNHTGQVGPAGPTQGGAAYDPLASPGPSNRFADFVLGADVIRKGYTFVMVDLRGFGGSNGCLDWGGPGEQADVVAAVEWAASQPWSTGKVGMFGKSYDGVTGLLGEILNPKGLAAVVAQEPVYDMYRYLYSEGMRFHNSLATPGLYDAIAATPGSVQDEPGYVVGSVDSTARPGCEAGNWADQQDPNHQSDYWKARDLIAKAGQGRTPLFLTQGFLENNTKPDGTWDFFNAVEAPKRAWFGMWDHVRGSDVDADGRLLMGRRGFNAEVMRFYDRWLRGVEPEVADPTLAIQSNDGRWRGEEQWPPADSKGLTIPLTPGEYVDDANTRASNDGVAVKGDPTGIWTISPPLPHAAHIAGVPRLKIEVETQVPDANFAVAVYDIDPEDRAILVHRNGRLLPESGAYTLDLYGNDWRLKAGHRVGVMLSTAHNEWWLGAIPTDSTVTVKSATLDLPFLTYERTEPIDGKAAVRLENYLANTPITLPKETIDGATVAAFPMPAKLSAPAPPVAPGDTAKRGRLTAKIRRVRGTRRRIAVRGRAPRGSRVTVRLRRGGLVRKTKRVRVRNGRYVARFKVQRAGRYRAVVRVKSDGRKLRKRTRTVRVRR
jgi:predicted acyl esterase